MKRIMIASVLALTTAGTAFAASEAEISRVQPYVPDYDVSAWSDTQIAQAMNVIQSEDSRAEITSKLRAMAEGTEYTASSATISEAEMAMLNEYVDGVDYTALPQATVDAAISVAQSEMSAGERETRIQQLLSSDTAPMSENNTATAAEAALIERHAPGVDVATLSESQVNQALAIIYSSDSEADTKSKLEGILM